MTGEPGGGGPPPEVVAAIAAAVALCLEAGMTAPRVTSVTPVSRQVAPSVWGLAARLEAVPARRWRQSRR